MEGESDSGSGEMTAMPSSPVFLALATDLAAFSRYATVIASIVRRTPRRVVVRCYTRGLLPESFEVRNLRVDFVEVSEGLSGNHPWHVASSSLNRLRIIRDEPEWDRAVAGDLVGENRADGIVRMVEETQQLVPVEGLAILVGNEREAGGVREGFLGEVRKRAAGEFGEFDGLEVVVLGGAPWACGELEGFGEPGRRRACQTECFARHGEGERVSGTPFGVVIAFAAEDGEGAVEAAGEFVVPAAVVHELAVVIG